MRNLLQIDLPVCAHIGHGEVSAFFRAGVPLDLALLLAFLHRALP